MPQQLAEVGTVQEKDVVEWLATEDVAGGKDVAQRDVLVLTKIMRKLGSSRNPALSARDAGVMIGMCRPLSHR